jgi:hypothetical protein
MWAKISTAELWQVIMAFCCWFGFVIAVDWKVWVDNLFDKDAGGIKKK